jgi:MFS family permease
MRRWLRPPTLIGAIIGFILLGTFMQQDGVFGRHGPGVFVLGGLVGAMIGAEIANSDATDRRLALVAGLATWLAIFLIYVGLGVAVIPAMVQAILSGFIVAEAGRHFRTAHRQLIRFATIGGLFGLLVALCAGGIHVGPVEIRDRFTAVVLSITFCAIWGLFFATTSITSNHKDKVSPPPPDQRGSSS